MCLSQTLDSFEMRRYSDWKGEVAEAVPTRFRRGDASAVAVRQAAKRLHLRLLRRHDRP